MVCVIFFVVEKNTPDDVRRKIETGIKQYNYSSEKKRSRGIEEG